MLYMVEMCSIGFSLGGGNELDAAFLDGGGGGGRDVRNGPVLSSSRRMVFSSVRSYSSECGWPMSITTNAYSRVHA